MCCKGHRGHEGSSFETGGIPPETFYKMVQQFSCCPNSLTWLELFKNPRRVGGKLHMALTKAHIVEMIAEQNGFPKNKSVEIVEDLIEIIKGTLEAGDDVLVSGFGKFSVKSKGSRRGRNPATGSDLMLSARKVVTFKCSGKFREKLNP
jgi:integration host factor subunit alpha